MIDFTFPPEVEEVRLKVREFMDERVRPAWEAIDQDDRGEVVKTIVALFACSVVRSNVLMCAR